MTHLFLAVDIGTGSVRAALVDGRGKILDIAAREHDQIVPEFGWAEQRPLDWWEGARASIATVLGRVDGARDRIAAVCVCGQMHGLVLLDGNGELTRGTAPLWNDKRTIELVRRFEEENAPETYLPESGNTPTPAWPGFKLQWVRDNDPEAYARSAVGIMPKDYINYRLTGEIAMDTGDASCSFLMNPERMDWSPVMIERMGLERRMLPPIRNSLDIIGHVTQMAARDTGLNAGTPVLVGGADYPVALLGSGACRPGLGSDSTGTGAIITVIAEKPLLDPEISNVATIEGNWGPFVLLETGGGARTALWLKIKASVFGIPIIVPQEPECGIIGCAAMAATATGRFGRVEEAADRFVEYRDEIPPDPAWAQVYRRMQPVFDKLYHHSQALYDDLDVLEAAARG